MSNRKRARKSLSLATSAALAAGLLSGLSASPSSAAIEGFTDVVISKGLRAGVEQYTTIDWIDSNSYWEWDTDYDPDRMLYSYDYDFDHVDIVPLAGFNLNTTDGLPSASFDAGGDGDWEDYLGESYSEFSANDWEINLKEWPAASDLQNDDFVVIGADISATQGSYQLILKPEILSSESGTNLDTDVAQNFTNFTQDGISLSAGKYVINVEDTISGFNTDLTIIVGNTPTRATLSTSATALPIEWEGNFELALFDAVGNPTSFDPDESESYSFDEVAGNIFSEGVSTSGFEDFDFFKGTYDEIGFSNEEAGNTRVWAEIDAASDFDSNSVNIVTKDWVTDVGDCYDGAVAAAGVAVENDDEGCQNDDVFVRTGTSSVSLYYNGGSSNADKYVGRWDGEGQEIFPVLTDANGNANFTVSMTGINAGNTLSTGMYTWGTAADDDDESDIDLHVEAPGFAPYYELQNTSGHYNDDERQSGEWNHDDFESYLEDDEDWYVNSYGKSLLAGQDFTITFKVTDIWGTPVQGLSSAIEGNADSELVFDKLNITEVNGYVKETDSNGLVAFTVENELTMSDITEIMVEEGYSGIDNNEQAPILDLYNYAWADFFAFPMYVEYEGPFSSDVLYHEYLRDLTPTIHVDETTAVNTPIYVPVNGIDIVSDDQSAVAAVFTVVNSDNEVILGLPISVSASANGLVTATTTEDEPTDVFEMGTSASMVSGWDWNFAYLTNTKVGEATFTMSAGSASASIKQAFKTDATFARYLTAVNPAVVVEAGENAKAEFQVTDRFGNPISGIEVNMVGNILGAGAVTALTDVSGKVAVDVTTPNDANRTQVVSATVEADEEGLLNQFGAPAVSAIALPAGTSSASVSVESVVAPLTLSAVASAVEVEAGELATVQFKVTNAKGEAVAGAEVRVSGNLLGNGTAALISDSNGLVTVDVVTPAGADRSQVVTAIGVGAGFAAGTASATVTVTSKFVPAPLPTVKVVGVKGAARVWVYGAEAGDVVRTTIDGKVKAVRVLKTDDSLKVYKLAAGTHTIKLRVVTDRGTVTKTVKVKVKA